MEASGRVWSSHGVNGVLFGNQQVISVYLSNSGKLWVVNSLVSNVFVDMLIAAAQPDPFANESASL